MRGEILAVLSREKTVRNKKTGERETRSYALADVAKLLNVSIRTARRWKNENVKPAPKSKRAASKLQREASREVRRIAATQVADRKKHKGAVRLDRSKLPTIPKHHRRKLKRYKFDRAKGKTTATGEEYESNWANYDVRGWRFDEIAALLVQVWQAGRAFQFIYEVPAGGMLPKSGGKPGRKVKKTTRMSTAPIDPRAFEDEGGIVEWLSRYIDFEVGMKGRRMLYIAVDDNKPGGRR